MGCIATSPNEDNKNYIQNNLRKAKKSTKIDCRKKSAKFLDTIVQNITIASEKVDDPQTKIFIKETLRSHNLFCTLDQEEAEEIIQSMSIGTTPKNEYIFHQGDQGVCFFMIESGQVDIQIGGKYEKTLKRGDSFGELALLYLTNRSASVKSKSQGLRLLFIKAKLFKLIMKRINENNIHTIEKIFQKVQIFFCLNTKQKYSLVQCFKRKKYLEGQTIFKEGDQADYFYIIEKGTVSLTFTKSSKRNTILSQLQSFGQNAFKKLEGRRQGTAKAQTESICLYIDRQSMEKCLGDQINNIIYLNFKKWALRDSSAFKQFSNNQIQIIASQFKTKLAKANNIIIDEGKPVQSIIICLEGKINGKGIGYTFGDQYFSRQEAVILDQWVIKNDNGVYAELSFERLSQIIEVLKEKRLGIHNSIQNRRRSVRRSTFKENQNPYLIIYNFDFITKLGEGQFGQVYLVKDRKLGNLFALKCLDKKSIKKQGMEQSALSQRRILSLITHPLIVGYYKSFHDKNYIYFLLEYLNGIQMYYAIRQIGILTKVISRFYFGSILLAIDYLHSLNIIYRDVKPENCIVNNEGKVFLIDLGTAKLLKKEEGFRTETIIGTPHYLAPEVMQGKGYSFEADLWSLGVLLYELSSGRLPFAQQLDNPYDIYGEVMRSKVQFPKYMKDQNEKSIIRLLLEKNPAGRLENGNLSTIKKSKYFEGLVWKDLEEGKIQGPYIPKRFKNKKSNKYDEVQGFPLTDYIKEMNKDQQSFKIEEWNSNIIQI